MIAGTVLFALAVTCFVALCAGLPRYQKGLCGRKLTPTSTRAMRLVGWTALAVLAAGACTVYGFGRGLVALAGFSTVGAALAVTLANRNNG